MTASDDRDSAYRQRLFDGLAASIRIRGFRGTTVADIVRHARTSRRTFYQHFADRDACYLAMVDEANRASWAYALASIDPDASPIGRIRQAADAFVDVVSAQPEIVVSSVRDLPTLGGAGGRSYRAIIDRSVDHLLDLSGEAARPGAHGGVGSRQLTVMIFAGLLELAAGTIEDGGDPHYLADILVAAFARLTGT